MKFKILPLAGDASFRTFYRIYYNNKSKIIVLSSKDKYKNLIAYSSINSFLKKNKILTPKLYKYDFKKGIIVIEDFGDTSFYKILKKNKNKILVYKKLVDLLLKIQKIKTKNKLKNVTRGFHKVNKYSVKHLHKESDLFFDWYLPIFFNKNNCLIIKKKTKKILSKLYSGLNFPNSCFVHRDYHAQNLMKIGNKIGVIDSQDALIGNPTYDLVSLIDDVRIKTSHKLKKQIYNYYLSKTSKIHKKDSKFFLEDFDILSVQRSLKIIGIFSRLFKRDKKKRYLKYIPYTWKLLEMRIKEGKFTELKKILDSNINRKYRKKILNK